MIGIFLLLCLLGICVLWTVVGIAALKKRWVARRERKAMLLAHATQLAERQRIYDEATPKTSITLVLDQLTASAGLVIPDLRTDAVPKTIRSRALGALRGLHLWSRATSALPRIGASIRRHARSAVAAVRRAAVSFGIAIAVTTRAFARWMWNGARTAAIGFWRFVAPHVQRLLAATTSRVPRAVKVLVKTESTLIMWPPPIPQTSPSARTATSTDDFATMASRSSVPLDAATPRATTATPRRPPPPFRPPSRR